MNKLIAIFLICFLPSYTLASDQYGGIKLLEGYKIKKDWGVDAAIWTIYKEGGLIIDFEAGPNEGFWANPKDKGKYVWYREQVVNGHKVMLALIKPGLQTVWEPDKPRSPEVGNILLVTFPLGGLPDYTANFKAEILNEEELGDALLMVLTFDPSNYK
jgi:hypothetical protein